MKSKTDYDDKKTDADFYDWWDSVESRIAPVKETSRPIDERKDNPY